MIPNSRPLFHGWLHLGLSIYQKEDFEEIRHPEHDDRHNGHGAGNYEANARDMMLLR